MTSRSETNNMAIFCDFENVALGVREAKYAQFDINKVLERLLLKGSIVVKKAYCDWERYKEFKPAMHHASFELIEIPHLRQSGKNSADIRMVVDALDLCYTKSHVDTFVVISGDSDFSPLVSKLRENAKIVIGVGVKKSTSDLLMANCDEFIFYDDLVREERQKATRREPATEKPRNSPRRRGGAKSVAGGETAGAEPAAATTGAPREGGGEDEEPTDTARRKQIALDLVVQTVEALTAERGEDDKLWGSMIKQTLKRRNPGFTESYYGYRSFNTLLEDARAQHRLELERDEKSGGYIVKSAA